MKRLTFEDYIKNKAIEGLSDNLFCYRNYLEYLNNGTVQGVES